MRIKQVGNKGDTIVNVVRNAELTKTIKRGTPVVFSITAGANNSVDVTGATTAGSTQIAMAYCAGIATTDIAPGQFGEALVYGYCPYLAFSAAVRTATTDPFPSFAQIPAQSPMVPTSVGDALTFANITTGFYPQYGIYGVGTISSMPAIPSSPTNTALTTTAPFAGYVRLL